jgi:tetratricopeptide (TPR) repeat protein
MMPKLGSAAERVASNDAGERIGAKQPMWCYVSPQRIREGVLAVPHQQSWNDIEDLNVQRLARVLEFEGCIGFVGSAMSIPLGYPRWDELLPDPNSIPICEAMTQYHKLRELAQKTESLLEIPQALEIAEELLGNGDRAIGRRVLVNNLIARFRLNKTLPVTGVDGGQHSAPSSAEAAQHPPLERMLELPIRKFVTTNYELEIEKEINRVLGRGDERVLELSIIKGSTKRMAEFSVANAKEDTYQVFHCHGILPKAELDGESSEFAELADLILTDRDYKRWYLSDESAAVFFQRTLDILLQSNPLLFVGYSLSDVDLVRVLRRLSTKRSHRRVASSLFGVIHREEATPDLADEYVNRGLQIKWGLNLFPYDYKTLPLTAKLAQLKTQCSEARANWRLQACATKPETHSVCILPNDRRPVAETTDTLFKLDFLKADAFLNDLERAVSAHSVVALTGPADAGKYVKVSQFLRAHTQVASPRPDREKFFPVVFSTHGSEDIYSYLKRVVRATFSLLSAQEPLPELRDDETIVALLRQVMNRRDGHPLLIVLTGLDHFLDYQTEFDTHGRVSAWKPRNRLAAELIELLGEWSQKIRRHHVLLACRALPPKLSEPAGSRVVINCVQKNPSLFSSTQLGNLSDAEYLSLTWHLQDQHAALLVASAYVVGFEPSECPSLAEKLNPEGLGRERRLRVLLEDLVSHPSDYGLQVVTHVVRQLEKYSGQGPAFESLLRHLSCFKTPVSMEVLTVCFELSGFSRIRPLDALDVLLSLRLVEATGPLQHDEKLPLFVIPPLVKRFCRAIVAGSAHTEKRSCGVHGLLSRGPFNEPDSIGTAQNLFKELVNRSYEAFKSLDNLSGRSLDEKREISQKARWFTRAVLEVLRSNFACNSVSRWGTFGDYVDMCSTALDLVKNLAMAIDETWVPGSASRYLSPCGAASAEEMLFLYNELGLAYYNEGAIQDALSTWGLAFEWQKAIARQDQHQGVMYAASLNSHMAMAYMQMGRMEASADCITKAISEAGMVGNEDLEVRLRGILGRLNYFRGSLGSASETFHQIVDSLDAGGNRRAQSYFLRHWASLEIRLKRYQEAEQHLQFSLSIAASEGCRDNVAFARELLGRLYREKGQHQDAIREFRAALVLSRELGIARLEADACLGIARVQLALGDAMAARDRATDALKIANECLLVLRQIKALMILGEATVELREVEAGTDLVRLAKRLAAESGFRLAEHDADQSLAILRAGRGDGPRP